MTCAPPAGVDQHAHAWRDQLVEPRRWTGAVPAPAADAVSEQVAIEHRRKRRRRDEAVDALTPFAQLPDWLAARMVPGRLDSSLRANVPELRDGRLRLLECRADQLRAKDASWLVRCRAVVAASTDEAEEALGERADPVEVVLAGELYPPSRPDPAVSPGAGFGEPGYEVFLPDLRVHLHTEHEDPGLPSLGVLSDPDESARLIERVLRSGVRPGAIVASSRPRVARDKPGSRCTILYDLTYDPTSSRLPNPVVAKTHQGDKGAVAHEAARHRGHRSRGLSRGLPCRPAHGAAARLVEGAPGARRAPAGHPQAPAPHRRPHPLTSSAHRESNPAADGLLSRWVG